jgi:hypothetical protein
MIDAAQCRRQAALCEVDARNETDSSIQIALVSMGHGWMTLAQQLDWVEIKRKE